MGARTALPIWLAFMSSVDHGADSEAFRVPEGIRWAEVNLTGNYPLPVFESAPIVNIPFIAGTLLPPGKNDAKDGSAQATDASPSA